VERYVEEAVVIEQEDLLGQACREAQDVIRYKYKLLQKKVMVREVMLAYNIEMMIRDYTY
jgi:hypothetical protein